MTGLGLVMLALGVAGCTTSTLAGTTSTTVPAAGGQQVVVQGPARGPVHHSVGGEVTDIDRDDSELTVTTPDGSEIEITLPPFALATIREGDHVWVDMRVTPR